MIRNSIQRFMYGRHGNDSFNLFLIGLYLFFYLLYVVTRVQALYLLSLVLVFFSLFRLCSRNLSRRRDENSKFMRIASPALQWLRLQRATRRDREHRYFKCPSCAQQLRVPRGKGKITVTCRNCGACFQEKS